MTDNPSISDRITQGAEQAVAGTQRFVDSNFTGKFSGVTENIATKLDEATSGHISEKTTRGALPFLAAGAAGLIGVLLLKPIQWATQNIFKGAKQLVTGFGYLEKIPVIGGIFKFLGDTVEGLGSLAGYVVPAIAAFIGYKAFQSPSKETPLAIPNSEHLAAAGTAAALPAVLLARSGPVIPVTEKTLGKLHVAAGGKAQFEVLHERIFGAKPGTGGAVDPQLTESRGVALLGMLEKERSTSFATHLRDNELLIRERVDAQTPKSNFARKGLSRLTLGWVAPRNKANTATANAARSTVINAMHTAYHNEYVPSDSLVAKVQQAIKPSHGTAAAAAGVSTNAAGQTAGTTPPARPGSLDIGKLGNIPDGVEVTPSEDGIAKISPTRTSPLETVGNLALKPETAGTTPSNPARATLTANTPGVINAEISPAGTISTGTPPPASKNTAVASAASKTAVNAAASETAPGFLSTGVRPAYTGALGITALGTALPTLLDDQSTTTQKTIAGTGALAGAVGTFVPAVGKILAPVGGAIIAPVEGVNAYNSFKAGNNFEGAAQATSAVGGAVLLGGGITAAAGGSATVAALANPVGVGLLALGGSAYGGYQIYKTTQTYAYIDSQFKPSTDARNLLSSQGQVLDRFKALGGTTFDREVDMGDGTSAIRTRIDFSDANNVSIFKQALKEEKKALERRMDAPWLPRWMHWTDAQQQNRIDYETAKMDVRILESALVELPKYAREYKVHNDQIMAQLAAAATQHLGHSANITPTEEGVVQAVLPTRKPVDKKDRTTEQTQKS